MAQKDLEAEVSALRSEIKELAAKVAALSRLLDSALNLNEGVRTRFQDNGAWAIHYSTVRMTVSTFAISLCLGIMSFKWNAPGFVLVASAVTFWLLGAFVFFWFSYLTLKMMRAQAEKRLVISQSSAKTPSLARMWLADAPSYIIFALTIIYLYVARYYWSVSPAA
jgi:hypothetical protein